ncbi:MAG TPA: hypothetical protein VJ964_15905 [Balneolaceae bacterium]|nr:hypothetical protein [Balneolaceae bacterium]
MPQKRIPLEPGQIYHIWTHANGDENLFREDENYRYFLEKYAYYVYPIVETFAYCLMPNHLHLMVRVRKEADLLKRDLDLTGFQNLSGLVSKRFSNLFNAYTKAYNKKYNRMGSLFIRGFQRKKITNREYFSRLIVYIHNNPVHHGFVEHTNNWPHTSWHAYVLNRGTKINREEGLKWFGGKKAFKQVHKNLNPPNLVSVFDG